MNQQTDIIFGNVLRRVNRYIYELEVRLSTNEEKAPPKAIIEIDPTRIIVNGLSFDAQKVDNLFVEKSIIGKKVMFAVRESSYGGTYGELFKIPFGKGNAVRIPNEAIKLLNSDAFEEFKQSQ